MKCFTADVDLLPPVNRPLHCSPEIPQTSSWTLGAFKDPDLTDYSSPPAKAILMDSPTFVTKSKGAPVTSLCDQVVFNLMVVISPAMQNLLIQS